MNRLLDKTIERSAPLRQYYLCPNPRPRTVTIGRVNPIARVGDLFFSATDSHLWVYDGAQWRRMEATG